MLLLGLGAGVGVTDCHSQCTHWLRNDTGSCMGCGGAGDRKGHPYGGERTPLRCIAEFAACERQNYARSRLGAFWRKNRRFFARDDKRAVPEWDSPFESVKRVYCAALAALMDSISSGTTLNRSPVMP